MKIGIDTRVLQTTSSMHGVGYYVRGLVGALLREANNDYVFFAMADRPQPDWSFLPSPERWKVVGLDPGRSRVGAIKRVPKARQYQPHMHRWLDRRVLSEAVRRERVDVLHLPALFEPEFFADGAFSCPVVKTVYDLIPFLGIYKDFFGQQPRDFAYLLWKQLESIAASDALVAISQSAADDLQRMVPAASGKVCVVYPGVGPAFSASSPEARARVRKRFGLEKPYFVFSGGVDPRKNLEIAVAAFGQAFGRTPDVSMVVSRSLSNEALQNIRLLAWKAGLPPGALKFPGFVSDSDLPALYGGSLALVYPSSYEGFGLPVVEAMRCGCPVITAENSSLPEAAGDAAILIRSATDPEALADAMRRIVDEPGLAEALRVRGMDQSAKFTWEESARQYLAIYAKLVAGDRSPMTDSETERGERPSNVGAEA